MKPHAAKAAILLALALALSLAVLSSGRASAFPALPGASSLESTSVTLSSNPPSSFPGASVTLTAVVVDTGTSPSVPAGTVSFSDGGAGGTFLQQTCTLAPTSGAKAGCSVGYTISSSATTTVSVVASYSGDSAHSPSAAGVSIALAFPVSISITPASSSVVSGRSVNFTATLSVPGTSSPAPTGGISWSDNGAGGTFSSTQCQLVSPGGEQSSCTVKYTSYASVTISALQATITVTYPGDSFDGAASASTGLTVLPPQVSVLVSYSVVGSTQGSSAPVFTYLLNNKTQAVPLSGSPSVYKVDVNTMWFVPNQLGNSSSDVAWNLLGSAQGSASYSLITSQGVIPLRFVYYHQVRVTLGYAIEGGTAGASVPPFVTYTSFGVTKQTGAPGTTWVDFGTQYAYPAELPGSLGTERWVGLGPNGSASAVNGTLTAPGDYSVTYYHQFFAQVAFGVVDPPSVSLPPPTFFGVSLGVPFNASAASMSSRVWLDAGSQYSFTNPLVGSNSTVRWDAGAAGSGMVAGPTIDAHFYRQYPVNASAVVVGGSPPLQSVGQSATAVGPAISGLSAGQPTNFTLSATPSPVWLDSGSGYSISSNLLTQSTERWIAAAAVRGSVAPGESVNQTYFHQYLLRVSYSAGPSTALDLAYTSMGVQTSASLDAQGTVLWVDAGSAVTVPDQTAGERWSTNDAQSTTASSANMTLEFFHQAELQVSLDVVGGGLPVPTYLSGTSGGQPVKVELGTQPVVTWLDTGSSYLVPRVLLQLPQERWVAAANLTGSVTSPVSITQTFYHQALLNLSSTGLPSSVEPAVEYVALGQNTSSTLGPVWADIGTTFSLQNNLAGQGSGERYSGTLPGGTVGSPIQAVARYFHQYELNYSYAEQGGTLPSPPVIYGTQDGQPAPVSLANATGAVWFDAGSHWQVSSVPAQATQAGARWNATGSSAGVLAAPSSIQLSYLLQFLVTTSSSPAAGGSVVNGSWYSAGSDVTLSASPGQGWTLGGWQGTGAGAYSGANATVSIQVSSPMNETALFEPGVTVAATRGGSVRVTAGSAPFTVGESRSGESFVQAGQMVTFSAHPSQLYQFVGWKGAVSSTENPLTINATSPQSVTAVFRVNYVEVVGIPATFAATGIGVYLARGTLTGVARDWLDNFRTKKRADEE